LDRPRDGEQLLARPERRALGYHGDAREGELGVDRRRQLERRPDAGAAEHRDGEIDESTLLRENAEQRTLFHQRALPGGVAGGALPAAGTGVIGAIFALSSTPYAPYVT